MIHNPHRKHNLDCRADRCYNLIRFILYIQEVEVGIWLFKQTIFMIDSMYSVFLHPMGMTIKAVM